MVINPPGGHWGPWQWLGWPRPSSFGRGKTRHFTVLLDRQMFKQEMVQWGRINFSAPVVWELPCAVSFQEMFQVVWQQSDHRTSIQYMWGHCYGGAGRKMLLCLLDINRIQHVGEDCLHLRLLFCLAKKLHTNQSKPALLDTFCFCLIQLRDLKVEEVWCKHTALSGHHIAIICLPYSKFIFHHFPNTRVCVSGEPKDCAPSVLSN